MVYLREQTYQTPLLAKPPVKMTPPRNFCTDPIHRCLQGVFLAWYTWNTGPVYGTDIARSVVAIGRNVPFTINLSRKRSRGGTPERNQALDNFEAASPLMFRQREILKILVSERTLRHRDLRNKGKLTREFYTGYIVVVRN